ncbi:nicotinate-nucleotide--dimethylbenzimidazole phosphoribosyltransferase [Mesorhizobium koreense]|uniref:nicotinate-nucleotide--dimethylbenzimidazole phosphoribosyltransferase n=1 Tax=Mesorhizobium koreense TaxID=3074855 RepID=UPI00287B632B|nr:nicotinate-nucleotide--dimethylbenzimidazole phosphoribosyltransferase [Mesorhizobium sp. WR6]
MTSGLPFDDFRTLLAAPRPIDQKAADHVVQDFRRYAGKGGSLGCLEELAVWLAGWSGRPRPMILRPLLAIFAGSHGVAARNISALPIGATAAMVERCSSGAAPACQLCSTYDLGLKVFDLALDLPTGDIAIESALDEKATAATMAFGMEAIAGGTDLLCLSAFGVGNSTVAAAICAALFGGRGADWVGDEPGADRSIRGRKAGMVDAALSVHSGRLADPLEVLRRLGGREFAAIAGAIIAARSEHIPVVLDGYPAVAAAAVLHAVNPDAIGHCVLAGLSADDGQAKAAARLGFKPLLDLDIGESGVAAVLAAGLLKAASTCYASVAVSGVR